MYSEQIAALAVDCASVAAQYAAKGSSRYAENAAYVAQELAKAAKALKQAGL